MNDNVKTGPELQTYQQWAAERNAAQAAVRYATSSGSAMRDLALSVSNDISEDIDGGESREELREAVKWWASFACDEAQRRAEAEQTVKMVRLAKALMDVALPPNTPADGRASRTVGPKADNAGGAT